MASTKKKRQTKHRGNAAGLVETRGRTGRNRPDGRSARQGRRGRRARADRFNKPPSWPGSLQARGRSRVAIFVVIAIVALTSRRPRRSPSARSMVLLYTPIGFYMDSCFYKRRRNQAAAAKAAPTKKAKPMDVRMFTVGPVQENSFLVRAATAATEALHRRPRRRGRAPARRHRRRSASSSSAILLTHTPLRPRRRRRAGRPRDGRAGLLPRARGAGAARTSCAYVPLAGLRPVRVLGRPSTRSRAASGCSSAGLDIDVLFTPGHSPGHVTYAIADERRCSAATCCSRAPSAASTCRAATAHAAAARSRCCWSATTTTRRSTRATWASRRSAPSARTNPFLTELARLVSDARSCQAPARHLRRAARAGRRSPARRGGRPLGPRARGLPARRDADLRGHRAVRARRRRGDRHRPEGDVHLRGRRRAVADAAPRGHRAGLPRLRSSTACTSSPSR